MRGTSIRWSDWAVLATLAVWACLIGWEGYRRGVTVGTLTLGGTALLMFVILGSPWSLGAGPARWNAPALLVAACCFLLGWVSDLLLAMAVAWSSLLWAWLDGRLNQESNPRIFRLLILTLFVFPWVDTDLKPVSWWLRVTSAAASQAVLTQAGLPTTRDGTGLSVAGRLVEVNEQCDGRETLHAMLIVGLAAATVYLGTTRPIWPWLAPLLALAWVANTLRVLLVCLGAVWFEEERYRTWLHDWGGWLVVALMLGLCLCCFSLWNRFRARGTPPLPSADEAGTPPHSEDTAVPREEAAHVVLAVRPRGDLCKTDSLRHTGLWLLLIACVVLGVLWRAFPPSSAYERLQCLPQATPAGQGRDVPLTESERRWLGSAMAIKRIYRMNGREYLVTAIDGTANRHAVHDPSYCWTVTESADLPICGGHARSLRAVENGSDKEVLYWFSDGTTRHTSPLRCLVQTSLRRVTFGWSGQEPVLVLIEPVHAGQVNWFRVLDGASWLMEL